MAVIGYMSESANGVALVVGGSAAERERWTEALDEHARVDADAVADGATALDRIHRDVQALLVHRELPDFEASELLSRVREQGVAVRAALLSPESPTEEVVTLGFDAWLRLPVESELLARTVDGLLACRAYDRAIAELYELATEQAQDEMDRAARDRVEAAREEADAALEAIDPIDRKALLANNPSALGERRD